jgi:crotonobetainyl-CoA:carnitine CoA-transferase CaiB-like acyl-CoA transferase
MAEHKSLPSYDIPVEARVQIMTQLAVAWDGQWFLKVYDKFGWDAASEINARVRASWSKMEMRSTLRALGKRKADDLADALAVWQAYMSQVFGSVSNAFETEQVIEANTLRMITTKCAVLEGAKRAKLERTDQACIACEVAHGTWFKALLPDYEVSTETISQMGSGAPQCQYLIRAIPLNAKKDPSGKI